MINPLILMWKKWYSLANDFSAYFSNLAENLASKLPNPSSKYGVLSVAQYYSHLELTKKFDLLSIEKDYLLKVLRNINTSKAGGIDRLPRRFVKDGANVLAKPIIDIVFFQYLWINSQVLSNSQKSNLI